MPIDQSTRLAFAAVAVNRVRRRSGGENEGAIHGLFPSAHATKRACIDNATPPGARWTKTVLPNVKGGRRRSCGLPLECRSLRAPMNSTQGRRRDRQQLPAPHRRARPRRGHLRGAPLRRHAGRRRASRRRAARPGEDPHPLSARAERLPAHRPRQEHLPQLRPGEGLRRHLPPALRRHQPGEGRAGIRRRDRRRRALARLRLARARAGAGATRRKTTSHLYFASDYFDFMYRAAEALVEAGHAYVDEQSADEMRAHAATSRAPARQPVSRSHAGREPGAPAPDEERRARRRRRRAAREDRHGEPEHQPARPGALPHQARDPSQHGRPLVHLPDVHLRPSDRGRAREHHALDLHARVRGPAAVLRLAARHALHARPARAAAAAPVRVRAPQRHLRHHQQAQAEAARRREDRRRLGRPAHADDRRPAPARLHARSRSA